jgi:hypothetical protein
VSGFARRQAQVAIASLQKGTALFVHPRHHLHDGRLRCGEQCALGAELRGLAQRLTKQLLQAKARVRDTPQLTNRIVGPTRLEVCGHFGHECGSVTKVPVERSLGHTKPRAERLYRHGIQATVGECIYGGRNPEVTARSRGVRRHLPLTIRRRTFHTQPYG